ncbi:DUF4252 domain-containing protein [Flavobacteriaceae bacterium TK19130]|nr:DUF4252 domain-containing protein [Thermobacterium salinum]
MTLIRLLIPLTASLLALFSCSDQQSLQEYLVEKQDDNAFLKVDIATSLLESENSNFSPEERAVLETVHKINVVAFPIKDDSTGTDYSAERDKLKEILKGEKYKTLLKMGSNKRGATLKYVGEEDAIDELIVFASDNERGFAVFRLIGDNMEPDKMIQLMRSIDEGDVDVSSLKSVGDMLELGDKRQEINLPAED